MIRNIWRTIKQVKRERGFAGNKSSYNLLSDPGKPLIREMNAGPEELRESVMQMSGGSV